ncbi:hypothetical protein MTP10_33915 [Nonomuraea sp. 3-1Str]|nr:hypothetical protein [Nonomuraea sp. 3-1Str]MDR8413717.1 hypothetical protein [Nonomuraea sp. 3-1Str]
MCGQALVPQGATDDEASDLEAWIRKQSSEPLEPASQVGASGETGTERRVTDEDQLTVGPEIREKGVDVAFLDRGQPAPVDRRRDAADHLTFRCRAAKVLIIGVLR